MNEYKPTQGTTLRIVDGEYRLGFFQEKEWVELGAAVLAMTSHHEETGDYTLAWKLASKDENETASLGG